MLKNYEINTSTLAIMPIEKKLSRVLEEKREFLVNDSVYNIIDKSCKFFGSSYNGRFEGTKNLIGINYKSPIIIEETKNIIFFPTSSPRLSTCSWIALNKIVDYDFKKGQSILKFINEQEITLNISYECIENQILRATRLDSVLRKRKNNS